MRSFANFAAAAAVLSLLSTVPVHADESDWVLAGTVEIHYTQMSLLISGKTGGGTLEFAGKEHPFTMTGVGVGAIGVQKINAVGAVYNMDDVSKFPGTYVAASAGAAAGDKGQGYTRLSNQHGVILALKTSSKGLALSIGVEGVSIAFK